MGCQHGPGGSHDPGLSAAETRSHFGAWCITSSPLTLSHDVNNETVTQSIWSVISNREAIGVNQAWAGHSGSPFARSASVVTHRWLDRAPHTAGPLREVASDAPSWQAFYKPLQPAGAKTALLLMNHDTAAQDLTVEFSAVPGLSCSRCAVRDIYAKSDLGVFAGSFTARGVGPHDSSFLVVTPS